MKVGDLYNMPSVKSFLDSGGRSGFKDAEGGLVLARQLEHVNPVILTKKYPEQTFVNSGITVDNTGGDAESIRTLRTTEQGGFKDSKDKSDAKGIIGLTAEDSLIRVKERLAGSGWSDTDIKQAALANRNLVSEYLVAHDKAYKKEIDLFGYLGNPDVAGSFGLLNYPGYTASAASGAIATLTPQQMYDDISGLINDQHNSVNNTPEYMGTKFDMPIYVINRLSATMLNTANGSSTVLKALRDNHPDIEFRGTFRADNAGGVGVSRSVLYNNSSDAMAMRVPLPLLMGEIIKHGSFEFKFDSKYRIAGFDPLEDSAARVITGL